MSDKEQIKDTTPADTTPKTDKTEINVEDLDRVEELDRVSGGTFETES